MSFKPIQHKVIENSNSTYLINNGKNLPGTIFSEYGWGSQYVDNSVKWNVPLSSNDNSQNASFIYCSRSNTISSTAHKSNPYKSEESLNIVKADIWTGIASNQCNNVLANPDHYSAAHGINTFGKLQRTQSIGEKPWKHLPELDDDKRGYKQIPMPAAYYSKQIEAEKKRNDVYSSSKMIDHDAPGFWNSTYQTCKKQPQQKWLNHDNKNIGNYENFARPAHHRMVVKTVSYY